MSFTKTLDQQFWPKVKKAAAGKCWEWSGAKNKAGYGNIKTGGKYRNAHRVSYEIHYGTIPKNLFVCHKCDNPSCVNPNHLFLGTPQDNDNDKVTKGRQIRGEQHTLSKLTRESVLQIRKMKGSHQNIADKFGVSRRLIGMVKEKSIWKHI